MGHVQLSFVPEYRGEYDKELQDELDRKPNNDEKEWFDEHGILSPDRVLNGLLFDQADRRERHLKHPFPNRYKEKWRGCYLWFGKTEHGFISGYAGKSMHFQIRMSQHWSGRSGQVNKFVFSFFHGQFGYPCDNAWCAIWYISSEDERRDFEHLLISHTKPLYNRQ